MQVFADAALARVRILPVLQLEDAALAAPLARALVQGGVPVAEITLRTPAALAAIARLRRTEPGLLVGADLSGTRIHQEVGTQEWVLRGPNRDLAEGLSRAGAAVRFIEFNGGHDYAC